MAAYSGTAGSVVLMTGGTTNIVGIGEWSLDIAGEVVETSAFGDQWRKNIPGIRSFSFSFAGRGDSDASQTLLKSAILAGSVQAYRLYDSPSTYWNIGSAIFAGMSPSITFDGRGDVSYDFTGSDALTYV